MMRGPKWWRQARALVGGYFWLRCRGCGEWFGGYEDFGPGKGDWVTCSRAECMRSL